MWSIVAKVEMRSPRRQIGVALLAVVLHGATPPVRLLGQMKKLPTVKFVMGGV